MRRGILSKLIDMISPRTCTVCGSRLAASEETICMSCLAQLPYTDYWLSPTDNAMAQRFWGLVPVERAASLFFFIPHSDDSRIVYSMKYFDQPETAREMGRLMASTMKESGLFDGVDMLLPVPLTRKRQRDRGYNQSEMLALGVGEETGLPVVTDALLRLHFKGSQTRNASIWERRENVEGAFAVAEECSDGHGGTTAAADLLRGKHVMLVDDVVTTGATCLSCMQTMTKATAGDITLSVLSLAVVRQ